MSLLLFLERLVLKIYPLKITPEIYKNFSDFGAEAFPCSSLAGAYGKHENCTLSKEVTKFRKFVKMN